MGKSTDQLEILKDVLYSVFALDNIVNRFHNKVQFMNLSLLMQRAESWDKEKLEKVYAALTPILEEMEQVKQLVERLNDPVLSLIDTYTIENSSESA